MAGRNDDGIAVDIYTRLMGLKRDIVLDEQNVDKIKKQAADTFASYGDKLSRYEEEMPGGNPELNSQERRLLAQENEHEKLLNDLNRQINNIENDIEKYKTSRKDAQQEEDYQKAQYYDTKIKKAEADINQATKSVSMLAQQGRALNKKAENADNYLNKAAYRLFAAPYDRLDDTICCFIKLLLKRIEVNDTDALEAMQYADEMIGDLPISELKSAIDAIRGVLYLTYAREWQLVDKLENFIMSLIMAPIRMFVSAILDILRRIENEALLQAQDFFDDWIHLDAEDPETILDCVSFESFADFVYDEIDEFFRDAEGRVMDLYKLVEEQQLALEDDSLELGKKDQIRQWYKALTEISKYLDKIEEFSVTQTFGNWIQEFLYEFDMATTYNPETGNFESVDMRDCIAPVPNDGAYRPFLPENSNDVPSYNIDDMAEFDNFLRNNIPGLEDPDIDSKVPLSYRKPDDQEDMDIPGRDERTSQKPESDYDNIIDEIDRKLDGDENLVPEIEDPINTDVPENDADDIDVIIDMYQPRSYDCEIYFKREENKIKHGVMQGDDIFSEYSE